MNIPEPHIIDDAKRKQRVVEPAPLYISLPVYEPIAKEEEKKSRLITIEF